MKDDKIIKTKEKEPKFYLYKSKPKNIILLKNILKLLMVFLSTFLLLEVLLITSIFVFKLKNESVRLNYYYFIFKKWSILILCFYIINFFKKEDDENKLYNVDFWKIFLIIIFNSYLITYFLERFKSDDIFRFLFGEDLSLRDQAKEINQVKIYLNEWILSFNVLNVLAMMINFFIIIFIFVIFLLKPNKNSKRIVRLKIVENKNNNE